MKIELQGITNSHQHLTSREQRYDTFSSVSNLQPSRGVFWPCLEGEGAHAHPDINLINGLRIDGWFAMEGVPK